jgi:threonyl-tRNA synthetase
MFLAPTQVIFVPIADSFADYAYALKKKLLLEGIDSEVYDKNDSLNKRIRTAEKQRVPYVVILGEEEVTNRSVAIRDRRKKEQYNLSEDDFMLQLKQQLQEGRI